MAFKILIIGGTGYIGSRIFSELSQNKLFEIKTCDKELFGNCTLRLFVQAMLLLMQDNWKN